MNSFVNPQGHYDINPLALPVAVETPFCLTKQPRQWGAIPRVLLRRVRDLEGSSLQTKSAKGTVHLGLGYPG